MSGLNADKTLRDSHALDRAADIRIGLIGSGIQKSRTPAMHRAEASHQGLSFTYELFDIAEMDAGEAGIADMLRKAEDQGFAGVNVTYPYKREVLAHLDEISDAVRRVGAANTVVFRNGKRFGHNTDIWGFEQGFAQGLADVLRENVLLLGAGGAGGAVADALAGLGVQKLQIFDLDVAAMDGLVAKINRSDRDMQAVPVTQLDGAVLSVDGIVNATPMGMKSLPGMAISPELLAPQHWVADIVYFPLETSLLRAAKARGCRTLSGAGMAVFQAVRAFELFTGHKPDPNRMKAEFEAFSETDVADGGNS